MVLENELCRISVSVEERPSLAGFDRVCNPDGVDPNDICTARVIRIHKPEGNLLSVALLGLVTAHAEPCAVLENEFLTVITFAWIFRIDVRSGEIVRCVECDNMGGLLEIHPIDGGYILYGEGDIFRYDRDLKQIWRRGGRDILVCRNGEKAFWIDGCQIHFRDWEGWHYVLELDGSWIGNYRETLPDKE